MAHPNDRFSLIRKFVLDPHEFSMREGGVEITNAQLNVLQLSSRTKTLVVTKARQIGMSTVLREYSLWCAFMHGERVLYLTPNSDTAKDSMEKLAESYHSMPAWLSALNPPKIMRNCMLAFANGGQIEISKSHGAVTCGSNPDVLIYDEAAWCDNTFDDMYPQVMSIENGRTIIASTLGKPEDWFERLRVRSASLPDSQMAHLTIGWHAMHSLERLNELQNRLDDATFCTEYLCMYPEAHR